ncbi:Platelet-Derived Growth Factor D [Manis pentadactyla]|nr:Platelet-Derived Growth Factor D [Manis pentadactyla]
MGPAGPIRGLVSAHQSKPCSARHLWPPPGVWRQLRRGPTRVSRRGGCSLLSLPSPKGSLTPDVGSLPPREGAAASVQTCLDCTWQKWGPISTPLDPLERQRPPGWRAAQTPSHSRRSDGQLNSEAGLQRVGATGQRRDCAPRTPLVSVRGKGTVDASLPTAPRTAVSEHEGILASAGEAPPEESLSALRLPQEEGEGVGLGAGAPLGERSLGPGKDEAAPLLWSPAPLPSPRLQLGRPPEGPGSSMSPDSTGSCDTSHQRPVPGLCSPSPEQLWPPGAELALQLRVAPWALSVLTPSRGPSHGLGAAKRRGQDLPAEPCYANRPAPGARTDVPGRPGLSLLNTDGAGPSGDQVASVATGSQPPASGSSPSPAFASVCGLGMQQGFCSPCSQISLLPGVFLGARERWGSHTLPDHLAHRYASRAGQRPVEARTPCWQSIWTQCAAARMTVVVLGKDNRSGLDLPGSCLRKPEARGAWRQRVGRAAVQRDSFVQQPFLSTAPV